jgi:hypothetical protein
MFREMQYADRTFGAMDFADKMAERRRHSLAATSNPARRARLTRMLFAVAEATGSPQSGGRA